MPARDRTRRRIAPRQARAQASIDAILTAAELLLAERGYARTSTNHIAARAGVNVALVYRYFAGKEAIVGALIDRAAEATYASLDRSLAEHAGSPLPVALRALLVALAGTPGAPALHRELVEHVDAARRRELIADLRGRAAVRFAEFLAGRRELAPVDEATRFVIEHAVEAVSHAAAFYRPAELSFERVIDALVELVARALPVRRRFPSRSP